MQNIKDETTASFKIDIIKKLESMLRQTIIRAYFFDSIPRPELRLPRYQTWSTTSWSAFTTSGKVVNHVLDANYPVIERGLPRPEPQLPRCVTWFTTFRTTFTPLCNAVNHVLSFVFYCFE